MLKIHKGIEKVTIGILPTKPVDLANKEQKDELVCVSNRIIENLALVAVPVESVVRFILLAAESEGIKLEWNAKQKLFRRAKND